MSPGLSSRRMRSNTASPVILTSRNNSPIPFVPPNLFGKIQSKPIENVPQPAPLQPDDDVIETASSAPTNSTNQQTTTRLPPIVKLESDSMLRIEILEVEREPTDDKKPEESNFVPFPDKYAAVTGRDFDDSIVFHGKAKKQKKKKKTRKSLSKRHDYCDYSLTVDKTFFERNMLRKSMKCCERLLFSFAHYT